MIRITINGTETSAEDGESLIDVINRAGTRLPQVCYHPQLGPIQTCDTCIVAVSGELVRACAMVVAPGMRVSTTVAAARSARAEAFDRILRNHQLYCTVCDNNNGSCAVHNTTKMLGVEHQHYPFEPSRTRLMKVIPSTATIPTNASCAAVVWKPVRTWK